MEYTIIFTRAYTYLDKMSKAINGFEITFEIKSNGEQHVIYVPRMDAALVKSEVEKFIAERKKLDSIGK